jgi:nucleotide-binding universal stress UspA family protein
MPTTRGQTRAAEEERVRQRQEQEDRRRVRAEREAWERADSVRRAREDEERRAEWQRTLDAEQPQEIRERRARIRQALANLDNGTRAAEIQAQLTQQTGRPVRSTTITRMIDAERRALAVEVQEERERDFIVADRIQAERRARMEREWAEQQRRREEAARRPVPPVAPAAPLPKIKIPKGQTDSLTEEEITDGMIMVDFNKQREQKHLYYTKSSYQKGVVERGRIDPYTRLPVKPETVVEYVAELDPDMPVVGARRRRKTRRQAMRRKTRRRV